MKCPMPSEGKSSPWFHEVRPFTVPPHSLRQMAFASFCLSLMLILMVPAGVLPPDLEEDPVAQEERIRTGIRNRKEKAFFMREISPSAPGLVKLRIFVFSTKCQETT